jgi:hypothetical protein
MNKTFFTLMMDVEKREHRRCYRERKMNLYGGQKETVI